MTIVEIPSLNPRGVPLIRFLYCDLAGVIRGKSVPAELLSSRLRSGVGCTVAMQAVTSQDHLVDIPGLGVVGEFRLVAEAERACTPLPYANAAAMMCDLYRLDRVPWEVCPRDFLKRMCARGHQRGLRARVGVEHEFHLARLDAGRYVPADTACLFGTEALDLHASYLSDVLSLLTHAGIFPTVVHAEYGPGQMEIAVSPADPLTAADHVCLFREITRGTARTAGMVASFAPRPFVDQMAGNGAHLHVSLWDEQEKHNRFSDSEQQERVSPLGHWFIGGVLAHLPALVALTCASVNSYQRLGPHAWSSAYTCWGFDNREAAIRVPSALWGQEHDSTNIEVRCADHSGNPYLAIGGLLAAGWDGIERQLSPGDPLSCDPSHLSAEEREQRGIQRLPQTLDDALNALEADAVVMEALGPLLASAYLAVKRAEAAAFAHTQPEDIALAHFLTY